MTATPDIMACAISRLLRDREVVFFGLASPLVMVSTLLAKGTHAPNLTFLSIPGSVDAVLDELPSSTVDSALLKGSKAIFPLSDIFDLSARGRLDTAFLSGVQIDRHGRINMSAIGPHEKPKVRLPGGAGSALLLPTARRSVLWRTRHDARTFVGQLDFVTAAGNVEWVITPLCLFRRTEQGVLDVHSIHPGVTPEQVAKATGFPVTVGPDTPVTPAPTAAELEALSRIDPQNVRASEF
ncbi:MAG TPA: CoA-transferase [Symbiobacteriaceae bacterium]|nr:CoA-transferase [Symbiobacteriaceae bacterium]